MAYECNVAFVDSMKASKSRTCCVAIVLLFWMSYLGIVMRNRVSAHDGLRELFYVETVE